MSKSQKVITENLESIEPYCTPIRELIQTPEEAYTNYSELGYTNILCSVKADRYGTAELNFFGDRYKTAEELERDVCLKKTLEEMELAEYNRLKQKFDK